MTAIASARAAVFSTLFDVDGKSRVAKQLDSFINLAHHRELSRAGDRTYPDAVRHA